MVLSAVDHNPELLSPVNTAQTMVYLADSFLHQKEFAKAEVYYRKALELRKTLSKQRGLGNSISKELSAETGNHKQKNNCTEILTFSSQIQKILAKNQNERTPRTYFDTIIKIIHA